MLIFGKGNSSVRSRAVSDGIPDYRSGAWDIREIGPRPMWRGVTAFGHGRGRRRYFGSVPSGGQPGFCFRVLEEGGVAAGDELVEIATAPERVTVFDVNSLLYVPGHPRTRWSARTGSRTGCHSNTSGAAAR